MKKRKIKLKQHNIVIMTKEESKKVAQQAEILRASERQIKCKILVVPILAPIAMKILLVFSLKTRRL
jgi:hypothetical protein